MTVEGYARIIIDKKDEEIEKLEQENEMLKQQLKTIVAEDMDLRVNLGSLKARFVMLEIQIEQAKEIIKEYIRLALQEPEEKDMIANIELFKKAEQFVEK